MKNNYKFLILSLILVLFSVDSLQAQRKNRVIQKADKAFDVEMYFEADELYKKGYKKTKNKAIKAEILFKRAECYRYQSKFKDAAIFYKKALEANYNDVIVDLRFAEMLMAIGKYEPALKLFKRFQKKSPKDTRAEARIISCQFAIDWTANPTRHEVYVHTPFNSHSHDYAPAWGNRDHSLVYFVSSRKGSSNDRMDDRTGQFFTDIYRSSLSKAGTKWSKPIGLPSPINTDNHEGTLCLNQNGTTMFFTTCQSENKKELGCEISISQLKGKLWGSLNKLEVKLDSNTTIGHPTVSSDEKVIIFSAEMNGGYGGKDLWMVTKVARGQWSEPANLGPAVNTDGHEVFPFLHNDGSLYFSSDGHIGLGQLDIYKSELDNNGRYIDAINLKFPINSSADDFGMIVDENDKGFLTSNRIIGIKEDNKKRVKLNGSDNIFWFGLPPLVLTLQGLITDTKTGDVITGANVKLVGVSIDKHTSSVEVTTDNTGSYYFELTPLTTYEIIVSREGYIRDKVTETTVGIEVNTDLNRDIDLVPILQNIVLPRIYYDFAKWDLRDTSKLDLDIVYNIMTENPEIVIQLNSHTDVRGENLFNMELSQKRADTCIDYLIQKGIDSLRMIPNGKGESEPYIITKEDENTYKKGILFKKKIFKEGQPLTELYINSLKKDEYKEIAHQFNRRTTFNVISQTYDPEFEKLFRNSIIGSFPEIDQTKSKNDIADFIWSVENNCQYSITVYHNGLSSGSTIILPGVTKSIKLIPGAYRVVAKVNDNSANVNPFSGWKRLKEGHEAITIFIITTNNN